MPGGKGNIKPEDGKQFSKEYQPKEKWTEKQAVKLGEELIEWITETDENGKDKGHFFFEEFLIVEKGLYREIIAYLSNKFTSFLKLINKAKEIQEIKLVKYGVLDNLNAHMTKFVLINHHNYADKQNIDHTTGGDKLTEDLSNLTFDEAYELKYGKKPDREIKQSD